MTLRRYLAATAIAPLLTPIVVLAYYLLAFATGNWLQADSTFLAAARWGGIFGLYSLPVAYIVCAIFGLPIAVGLARVHRTSPVIFATIGALLAIAALLALGPLLNSKSQGSSLRQALAWTTENLGWVGLFAVTGAAVAALFARIAFGPSLTRPPNPSLHRTPPG